MILDRDKWIHDLSLHGVHVDLEYFNGTCPVQAEGTVNGKPFYFRARHGAWTIDIVEDGCDPVGTWELKEGEHLFHDDGPDDRYGYGTDKEMAPHLTWSFLKFVQSTIPKLNPPPQSLIQECRDLKQRILFAYSEMEEGLFS